MKHWKGVAVVGATILGITSIAFQRNTEPVGGRADEPAPSTEIEAPLPEQPKEPRVEHYSQLLVVRQQYETQRVNNILITAQRLANEQGRQPLDLVREWKQSHAQAYADSPNPESLNGYLYAYLAESVILKEQPMTVITIPENAVMCALRSTNSIELPEEVYCNGR